MNKLASERLKLTRQGKTVEKRKNWRLRFLQQRLRQIDRSLSRMQAKRVTVVGELNLAVIQREITRAQRYMAPPTEAKVRRMFQHLQERNYFNEREFHNLLAGLRAQSYALKGCDPVIESSARDAREGEHARTTGVGDGGVGVGGECANQSVRGAA